MALFLLLNLQDEYRGRERPWFSLQTDETLLLMLSNYHIQSILFRRLLVLFQCA